MFGIIIWFMVLVSLFFWTISIPFRMVAHNAELRAERALMLDQYRYQLLNEHYNQPVATPYVLTDHDREALKDMFDGDMAKVMDRVLRKP